MLAGRLPGVSDRQGTLLVGGFLRGGRGLSANHLVHLTGFDDFQVLS